MTTALLLVLLTGLATAALAQFTSRGGMGPIATYPTFVDPTDGTTKPGNGFPLWIEDTQGIKLDLPVPPIGNGVDPPTMIFDPPVAGNQFSQDIGFGPEAFYYLAVSRIDLGNGDRAELTLAAEAAFGGEDPLNGDQFLFNRVRIRIDTNNTGAGTYTVRHPWSSQPLVFENVPADKRAINFTYDFGGFAPICPNQPACLPNSQAPGFERFLLSPTEWVFLRAAQMALGVDPNSWVGDGVTESTLVGPGQNDNKFTIITPTGQTMETDLFVVSGHIYGGIIPPPPPPPVADVVTITQARYTTRRQLLEVRATSTDPTAVLTANWGTGSGVLVNGRLRVTGVTPAPSTVTVTSDKGGSATANVQIR
jgi:hypothetical protein